MMEKFDSFRREARRHWLLFSVDNPFPELEVVAPLLAPDRIRQRELAIAYRVLQIDEFILWKICRKPSLQGVQLRNGYSCLSSGCFQFIARRATRHATHATKTMRPRCLGGNSFRVSLSRRFRFAF